jgi:hypothetical protein
MKMGQKSLAERAEWELAFANMAESREESAESELSGNALGLETAVGADQDLVARALEEEEIDRCDARARQLETMNVFWETEEEQREPKTEDELLKSLKEAGGLDEVWSLVSGKRKSETSSANPRFAFRHAASSFVLWTRHVS